MSGSLIVREVYVRRGLVKSGLPEYDYALNPYVGCQHGCIYCYAVDFTRGEPARNWGRVVYVKVNLPEVVAREVKVLKPGVVGLSTITDPYQPIESRYRLSRRLIEILCGAGFHVSIQTKSPLVIRDAELLARCGSLIDVGFTITTMGEHYRVIEPNAPHPLARASALLKLSRAGVKTWIFLGPIIPGFNDKPADYEPILRLAKESGSQVTIDRFRVRDWAVKMIESRLSIRPNPTRDWWLEASSRILRLCRDYGVECTTAEEEWARLRGLKRVDLSLLDWLS